ncbi:MAG: hypothetical protein ACI9XO_002665 [Paraglaciecola sp.]|jgi:hypothetical protein
MKKYFLKAINHLNFPPFSWLGDDRTWLYQQPTSILNIVGRTQRYRMAGAGLPITKNEKKLLAMKDIHKGERVFIIGNGPSLNKNDLTKLQEEYSFGVNGIFLNYDKMGCHPTYYVVEDNFVAEDRAAEINQYKGPKAQFFGNYLRYCIDDKPDNVWLNVKVDYREYEDFPTFSTNAGRQVWVGGTVTFISLQLAYWMGFSEVYLIGFDHSYHIPDSAKVEGNDITSTEDDVNHFHPDYFGKGYRWHDPMVDRMEKAFAKARKNFEADGRIIKNATVGGYLNVYDRVDYDSLF